MSAPDSLPFQVDLTGKVAVVTGGSGVLGSAMSGALAGCGAKVVVIGRDRDKAEKLANEILKGGGVARGISCNVLERASLEAAAAEVKASFGPCDILINGAGGNHPKGTAGQSTSTPRRPANRRRRRASSTWMSWGSSSFSI